MPDTTTEVSVLLSDRAYVPNGSLKGSEDAGLIMSAICVFVYRDDPNLAERINYPLS